MDTEPGQWMSIWTGVGRKEKVDKQRPAIGEGVFMRRQHAGSAAASLAQGILQAVALGLSWP